MPNFQQILREQLSSKASRSDVLRPLAWFIAIILSGLVGLVHFGADFWLLMLLGTVFGISSLAYLGAYIYCLIVDRDALRSERYLTDKLAIEHGVYGDDRTGMVVEGRETKLISGVSAPSDIEK